MASEGNIVLLTIKWLLTIINAVSAVYVLFIFFDYLSRRQVGDGFSIIFVISCVIGFVVALVGAYAAWVGDQHLLIIYGECLLM